MSAPCAILTDGVATVQKVVFSLAEFLLQTRFIICETTQHLTAQKNAKSSFFCEGI